MINYKKQSLYNTIGSTIYLFSLWLLTVVTTKITGYRDAGVLAIAIAEGNFFYSLQQYGGRNLQVSDTENEFSIDGYFSARLVTVGIGILLCFLTVFLLNYDIKEMSVIISYTMYRSFESLSESLFADLVKRGRLDVYLKSMILKSILTVIVFSAVLKFTCSLVLATASIIFISGGVTLLYDLGKFKRINLDFTGKPNSREACLILRNGFLLMFGAILPTFVNSYPKVVLERYYSQELVGYYGNVSTPSALISAVIPSLVSPFVALYSRHREKDDNVIIRGFYVSILVSFSIGLMCEAGVYIAGKQVMGIVYSDAIIPYVRWLYPIIISTTLYAMTYCANSVLISLKKRKEVAVFAATAAIACVLLAHYTIKDMGIKGVALTLGISYAVQFILQFIYILVWNIKKRKNNEYWAVYNQGNEEKL